MLEDTCQSTVIFLIAFIYNQYLRFNPKNWVAYGRIVTKPRCLSYFFDRQSTRQ